MLLLILYRQRFVQKFIKKTAGCGLDPSVPDSLHFGVDPDPDSDPAIFVIDL
jgi:hypothetical protein